MYSNTKEVMDIIVDTKDKYKMDCLGHICVKAIDKLKDIEPMMYKDISYQMHKLAYGNHLSENMAKCWVENMQNNDGTTGGHWSYADTERVRSQYMPSADPYDWFAVLNMEYSDNYDKSLDTSMYIQLAKNFIDDKDASDCKVLKYYMFVIQ